MAIISQLPPSSNAADKAANPEKTPLWKIALECVALFVALIVAAIYGGQLWVMNKQLGEMKGSGQQTDQLIHLYQKQLEQMSQQTKLLSSQLKGTSAAFLDVSVAIGNKVGDFDTALNTVKIIVRNSGHAVARHVSIHITVERSTIDGKPLGSPIQYNVSESALNFVSGTSEIYRRYVFMDSARATAMLEAAQRLDEILRIRWDYSYGNGFGETIKGTPHCSVFLFDDWIPCENFPAALADLRAKQH